MATRKRAAKGRDAAPPDGGVDLSTHPLVAERNVDPSEIEPPPPEQATLVGYIGPSNREGSVRLYQDLTFRNYYEIPSEAVVSTKPLNPDDENSPTVVQVEPDTKVEVVTVSVQSVEARYLSGSIAGGLYGAAAGVAGGAQAAGTLCGNITTYMPSCVGGGAQGAAQMACTNITTYMPSCVGGGGGPQVLGLAGTCTIIMTTMGCTFGGATTGIGPGTQVAAARGGYCTNITTYIPSCVAQQPCTNITTHMPSCVHCDPNCIATIVTSGVPGGGGQVCIDLYTANPSHCAQQCDPNCIATIVTSHHAAGGAVGFAAAAPGGQNLCTNITTYMPSCVAQGGAQAAGGANLCTNITTYMPSCVQQLCTNITTHMPSCVGGGGPELAARAVQPTPPQLCLTVVTANPTDCGQYCITRYTAIPSNCEPPLCLTVVTANPTDCGPCLAVVTANPTDCGPRTVVEAAAARAAVNVAPQPLCITLHTAYPSWCDPCRPIANTAATLCTQVGGAGTVLCITVYTHNPTWCPPPCRPVANTAATLCTQVGPTAPGTVLCPTVFTARPTGCG